MINTTAIHVMMHILSVKRKNIKKLNKNSLNERIREKLTQCTLRICICMGTIPFDSSLNRENDCR